MFFQFKKAESLVETMVAVFVIGLGAVSALALVASTMATTESVERRIIGINLAREGLEAVRSIRDTNWLVYPNNLRDFWACADSTDCTGAADLIQDGQSYIVDLDSDFRWTLQPVSGALALSTAASDAAASEDYQLVLKEGSDGYSFYTHDHSGTYTETDFYRELTFAYVPEDMEGTGVDDVLQVTCTVEWFDQNGRIGNVTLTTYLTDFYKRTVVPN